MSASGRVRSPDRVTSLPLSETGVTLCRIQILSRHALAEGWSTPL
jgi:hypothetical protein